MTDDFEDEDAVSASQRHHEIMQDGEEMMDRIIIFVAVMFIALCVGGALIWIISGVGL